MKVYISKEHKLEARIQELEGALKEIVDITETAYKKVLSGVGFNCHMIATEALKEGLQKEDIPIADRME